MMYFAVANTSLTSEISLRQQSPPILLNLPQEIQYMILSELFSPWHAQITRTWPGKLLPRCRGCHERCPCTGQHHVCDQSPQYFICANSSNSSTSFMLTCKAFYRLFRVWKRSATFGSRENFDGRIVFQGCDGESLRWSDSLTYMFRSWGLTLNEDKRERHSAGHDHSCHCAGGDAEFERRHLAWLSQNGRVAEVPLQVNERVTSHYVDFESTISALQSSLQELVVVHDPTSKHPPLCPWSDALWQGYAQEVVMGYLGFGRDSLWQICLAAGMRILLRFVAHHSHLPNDYPANQIEGLSSHDHVYVSQCSVFVSTSMLRTLVTNIFSALRL